MVGARLLPARPDAPRGRAGMRRAVRRAPARGFAELRSLPGIGDYTAGAVASMGFGVARARGRRQRRARLVAVRGGIGRHRAFCEPEGNRRTDLGPGFRRRGPAAFNEALIELGATVCRPVDPRCEECPIQRRMPRVPARRGRPVSAGAAPQGLGRGHVDARQSLRDGGGRVLVVRRPASRVAPRRLRRAAGRWLAPGEEPAGRARRRVLHARIRRRARRRASSRRRAHVITHHRIRSVAFEVAAGRARQDEARASSASAHLFGPAVTTETRKLAAGAASGVALKPKGRRTEAARAGASSGAPGTSAGRAVAGRPPPARDRGVRQRRTSQGGGRGRETRLPREPLPPGGARGEGAAEARARARHRGGGPGARDGAGRAARADPPARRPRRPRSCGRSRRRRRRQGERERVASARAPPAGAGCGPRAGSPERRSTSCASPRGSRRPRPRWSPRSGALSRAAAGARIVRRLIARPGLAAGARPALLAHAVDTSRRRSRATSRTPRPSAMPRTLDRRPGPRAGRPRRMTTSARSG